MCRRRETPRNVSTLETEESCSEADPLDLRSRFKGTCGRERDFKVGLEVTLVLEEQPDSVPAGLTGTGR